MEFRRKTVAFAALSGSGPRVQSFSADFPRTVATAVAGIAGFATRFEPREEGQDRDVGLVEIDAATSVDADLVTVDVTLGLRDWSGEWDDDYSGVVDVVVVAELEPIGAAPTRDGLRIADIEVTQATQFFRSGDHLDADNVMPDNSIRLIAEKPTGIRVYADYDATAGLPAIALLSGELQVETVTGVSLIRPDADITPRRDAEIDRGQAQHTLNFFVPENLCRGDVTFRCRVFDAADPTQASAAISRSKGFVEADLVRLFVVGVNYTGQGLNLPAPSLATVLNDFGLLESTFPTPGALATGYTTIKDFSEDMNASTPCARGFSELNELIADLRGDSEDIYIGALPSGINFGSFSGCANNGVASGRVGSPPLLAHEVGHRFGRAHAPCDSPARCDNPSSPDDEYPSYGTYASDSIGEYGYDPVAGQVWDPATSFDFMGYSNQNSWVSPYTYRGLMDRTAPQAGGMGHAGGAPGAWQPVATMTLFLSLTIDRQRGVARRPSFHFPAAAHAAGSDCESGFSVDFLDACHSVLGCHPLYEDRRSCARLCWPRAFRAELPLPSGARWLTVWQNKTKRYEECIPDPPSISLDCNLVTTGDRFTLDWAAASAAGAVRSPQAQELWFLVQWQDIDGSWRGLMPRTREHTAFVPVHLLGSRGRMRVRVLATSGIATGAAECLLTLPSPRPRPVSIVVSGVGPVEADPTGPVPIDRGGVRARAVDAAGREVRDPGFVWFDGAGREIARGRRLTRHALGAADEVRLVATTLLSRRSAPAENHWSVQRDGARVALRPLGPEQQHEPPDPYRPAR